MTLQDAFKKMENYLRSDKKVPYIVDVQNNRDYEALHDQFAVGRNEFRKASDYCNHDERLRLEDLLQDLSQNEGTIFLTELSTFLKLESEYDLKSRLKSLLFKSIPGKQIVVTYQCSQQLRFSDPRISTQIVVVDGERAEIPQITFVARELPENSFDNVYDGIEHLAHAVETADGGEVTIYTKMSQNNYPLSMFTIHDLSHYYDILANRDHVYIPRKEEWISIKNRIVLEGERIKFLTKLAIDIDIQAVTFSIPDFGLTNSETIIEPKIWNVFKDELVKSRETWGVVELGYMPPDESGMINKKTTPGKIKLVSFTNFCPYSVDLEYYKDVREEFTVNEWIDVVLGAIDYNAAGYESKEQKLTMLSRLLPFVEKSLNLIELAPKGTGKSYVFGAISRYGCLSAGKMTRAKLFYDLGRGTDGLVFNHDFIAFDEVQKLEFDDPNEMSRMLQSYMEQGKVMVGNKNDVASAGFVLLGNIDQEKMDEYQSMFDDLPVLFKTSAFMDRLHGFIKGWDIPRMNNDMKVSGWALNSEYFCTIMHLLRDDASYRAIVDKITEEPPRADTRDTDAIKKIATALLKLLFPNVRSPKNVDLQDFQDYCLRPATQMRRIVKRQQGMLDMEYRGKEVPIITIKDVYDEG